MYSFISTCAHTHAEKKNKPKKISLQLRIHSHVLWLLHRRPKRHSHILKWISVWAGRAPDNCIMFGDEEKTWQRAVLKKPMSFPLAFPPSWSFKAAGIFGSLVYSVLGAVSPWVTPYLDWYSTRSKCTFTCHFVTAHPHTYWMMERLFVILVAVTKGDKLWVHEHPLARKESVLSSKSPFWLPLFYFIRKCFHLYRYFKLELKS